MSYSSMLYFRSQNLPSFYVKLIHTGYLKKICNEAGSSLQGLKYVGGPVHKCEVSIVVPCVSYPESEDLCAVKCPICLESYDVENMLYPKVYT